MQSIHETLICKWSVSERIGKSGLARSIGVQLGKATSAIGSDRGMRSVTNALLVAAKLQFAYVAIITLSRNFEWIEGTCVLGSVIERVALATSFRHRSASIALAPPFIPSGERYCA